jgi:hypothetical protein
MENKDLYHYESLNEMAFNFPEMTKRELEQAGAQRAADLMASGELDEYQALASAERLKVFATSYCEQLRRDIHQLPEKNYKAHGVEFSMRNTGDRYDWEFDDVYLSLKNQLKQREDLLKVALKSDAPIYDADGVQVPKCPVKSSGGEVLTLKF